MSFFLPPCNCLSLRVMCVVFSDTCSFFFLKETHDLGPLNIHSGGPDLTGFVQLLHLFFLFSLSLCFDPG